MHPRSKDQTKNSERLEANPLSKATGFLRLNVNILQTYQEKKDENQKFKIQYNEYIETAQLFRVALHEVTTLISRCCSVCCATEQNVLVLYRGGRSSITQDAKVFDTGAEPSANTKSDLEPTASDWRKLLGNVNSLLVKRCIANHDFLNHISLMLGLLTECEKQAAAEKSR